VISSSKLQVKISPGVDTVILFFSANSMKSIVLPLLSDGLTSGPLTSSGATNRDHLKTPIL
jgi:hypothetical protein